MPRVLAALLAALASVVPGSAATAEVFRLTEPDGTVHLTNAPTDPRYQRLGLVSGTGAGWLRLPSGDTTPYLDVIREAAGRYGVPDRLVTAVIRAESGFNPRAVSRKGARGLMQLMPGTASDLGVRNTFDPRENIDGGVRHLRFLMDRFPGNLPLAIAAYNAGEGAVTTYRGIPPFPETREYVTRVLRFYDGPTDGTMPQRVYRVVADDGTIVYTNIPPRGRR
jgi:soluble lytic murein transglycosylase